MKVYFNTQQALDGKAYGAGPATLNDRIAYTSEFKKLVAAGHVNMVPRSEAEQKTQAHKDTHAVNKAAQANTAQADE